MTQDVRDLIAEAREAVDYSDDTGWFWVGRLVDALEASLGERDAAVAAIERVREEHQPCYTCAEPHCFRCKEAKWPCATFQALDGAPEPNWEYGAKVYNSGRVVRIEDSPEKVQLGRSATSYVNPQWVADVLVRRRKAGPWLPVEGESK